MTFWMMVRMAVRSWDCWKEESASSRWVNRSGLCTIDWRHRYIQAKTASQRITNSNNASRALSRPLFHPDDIRSALFPHHDADAPAQPSAYRPILHARTYSASAVSASTSPSFSSSLTRKPKLNLISSMNDDRMSPEPLTAPLPNMEDHGDKNKDVWDADFDYDDASFSAGVGGSLGLNGNVNGGRSVRSIRSVSASQQGSICTSSGGSRAGSSGRSLSNGLKSTSNQRGSIRSISERFSKYTERWRRRTITTNLTMMIIRLRRLSLLVEVTGTLLKLNSRLSNRLWLGDEDGDSDEEDVFAEVSRGSKSWPFFFVFVPSHLFFFHLSYSVGRTFCRRRPRNASPER